jgi:hypothetical protein
VEVKDHHFLLTCGAGGLVSGQETDLRISLPMKPMRPPVSPSNGRRELRRCILTTYIVNTLQSLRSILRVADRNACWMVMCDDFARVPELRFWRLDGPFNGHH